MGSTSRFQICCIGAGYVGGPTMAVIAKKCPTIDVTVRTMHLVVLGTYTCYEKGCGYFTKTN
jgi:UDP-N-acetyl-D-mannosaminuronate dehydrogenase